MQNDFIIFSFDAERRVWQSCQSMPSGCFNYVAIDFNGKIYVAGGCDFIGEYEHIFHCYDPTSDSWSVKATFETPKQPWLAKTNEFLYAIGTDWTIHQYDANQDEWTKNFNFDCIGEITGSINYHNTIYILCCEGNHEFLKMGDKCDFIRLKSTKSSNEIGKTLFFN